MMMSMIISMMVKMMMIMTMMIMWDYRQEMMQILEVPTQHSSKISVALSCMYNDEQITGRDHTMRSSQIIDSNSTAIDGF